MARLCAAVLLLLASLASSQSRFGQSEGEAASLSAFEGIEPNAFVEGKDIAKQSRGRTIDDEIRSERTEDTKQALREAEARVKQLKAKLSRAE
jgi:hypothetical protein